MQQEFRQHPRITRTPSLVSLKDQFMAPVSEVFTLNLIIDALQWFPFQWHFSNFPPGPSFVHIFYVVQTNYISLTFLAGPIFFTFWHLAIKLDCCRHHIVMVTTEPNDADGWNISIINNGKRFLKRHPFCKREEWVPRVANTCLPTLGLCKLMFCEGHWGPMEEGDVLEISIFFLSNLK